MTLESHWHYVAFMVKLRPQHKKGESSFLPSLSAKAEHVNPESVDPEAAEEEDEFLNADLNMYLH